MKKSDARGFVPGGADLIAGPPFGTTEAPMRNFKKCLCKINIKFPLLGVIVYKVMVKSVYYSVTRHN